MNVFGKQDVYFLFHNVSMHDWKTLVGNYDMNMYTINGNFKPCC